MKKLSLLTLIIISTVFFYSKVNAHSTAGFAIEFNGGTPADQAKVAQAAQDGIAMIDEALKVLEGGLGKMTSEEQTIYLTIFDPGNTGEIDEAFVEATYNNLQVIQGRLNEGLQIEFVSDSSYCELMTLYYTDFNKVYVCPFFSGETDPYRMARDLVHEVGHIAFLARDRAYFSETDTRYLELTPRGSAPEGLSIMSYILREIKLDDTLYHPDAYSNFVAEVTHEDGSTLLALHEHVVVEYDETAANEVSAMDQKLLNAMANAPQK